MSKLKVDELRSADRSVSDSANITLADAGGVQFGIGHGTLIKITSITATGAYTHTLQTSTNFSIVLASGGGGQGGGSQDSSKAGTGGGAGGSGIVVIRYAA